MAQCIDRAASFGQNLYLDTRGAAGEPVPFTQVVIDGLAQGGGLYVPEELPTLSLMRSALSLVFPTPSGRPLSTRRSTSICLMRSSTSSW